MKNTMKLAILAILNDYRRRVSTELGPYSLVESLASTYPSTGRICACDEVCMIDDLIDTFERETRQP